MFALDWFQKLISPSTAVVPMSDNKQLTEAVQEGRYSVVRDILSSPSAAAAVNNRSDWVSPEAQTQSCGILWT